MGDSTNRKKIIEGIKEITGFGKYEIYSGQVSAVDENETTIDVQINDELTIFGVRLKCVIDNTEGMYIIPAMNSYVVICQIDGGQDYNLIQASKIDKLLLKIGNTTLEITSTGIVFNGGSLDGLVKVNSLVSKMNAIEIKLNTILNVLKTISIPLAPSGTYPFAPLFAAIASLSNTVKNDLENPKIKQ